MIGGSNDVSSSCSDPDAEIDVIKGRKRKCGTIKSFLLQDNLSLLLTEMRIGQNCFSQSSAIHTSHPMSVCRGPKTMRYQATAASPFAPSPPKTLSHIISEKGVVSTSFLSFLLTVQETRLKTLCSSVELLRFKEWIPTSFRESALYHELRHS